MVLAFSASAKPVYSISPNFIKKSVRPPHWRGRQPPWRCYHRNHRWLNGAGCGAGRGLRAGTRGAESPPLAPTSSGHRAAKCPPPPAASAQSAPPSTPPAPRPPLPTTTAPALPASRSWAGTRCGPGCRRCWPPSASTSSARRRCPRGWWRPRCAASTRTASGCCPTTSRTASRAA